MEKESFRQRQNSYAEHCSGNTFSTKLAATFRENGHKEEEKHGTPEETMEGPTLSSGLENRHRPIPSEFTMMTISTYPNKTKSFFKEISQYMQ
jgi:hypothetical protein